jgi:hypothetical protein
MGQYLAIGITTEISTDKAVALKQKISAEEIIKRPPLIETLYDFEESDNYWSWGIKPAIFEAELLPFLETLYPDLYGIGSSDWEDVLKKLKETPPNEWLKFIQNDGFEAFQLDSYGESDYLAFPKKGTVALNYETIILALEGKISMECHGQLFGFFETALQNQYKAFELSKTLRVYITG